MPKQFSWSTCQAQAVSIGWLWGLSLFSWGSRPFAGIVRHIKAHSESLLHFSLPSPGRKSVCNQLKDCWNVSDPPAFLPIMLKTNIGQYSSDLFLFVYSLKYITFWSLCFVYAGIWPLLQCLQQCMLVLCSTNAVFRSQDKAQSPCTQQAGNNWCCQNFQNNL